MYYTECKPNSTKKKEEEGRIGRTQNRFTSDSKANIIFDYFGLEEVIAQCEHNIPYSTTIT